MRHSTVCKLEVAVEYALLVFFSCKAEIEPEKTAYAIQFIPKVYVQRRILFPPLANKMSYFSLGVTNNMAADWLGSLVSINCGATLGVYQGEVSAVDQGSQTISLRHPFHNGMKCLVPEVTFR